MKKNTLSAIYNFLNGIAIDNIDEVKADVEKELNRGAEKKAQTAETYAAVHDTIMDALNVAGNPVTVSEIYSEVKDALPADFTQGKLQYAMTRLWADELTVVEGKPNKYQRA